jgi:nucleoside-diphosphate-sugar epimerase
VIQAGDRVLVTGANGFVGSHLAEALLARGYQVRCMVRRTSRLDYVRDLPVEWVYADVRDPDELRPACEGVAAVCHCAALTRAVDRDTFIRVNTEGVQALARACLDGNPGLHRFLFVSSQAAAGPADGSDAALDESSTPRPVTWYGESKLAAEQALAALSRAASGRLPLTIVRPTPVMGPRERDFLAYYRLIWRGLNLQIGRAQQRMSLIGVHDLVDLLVLALEAECAAGQLYFGEAFDCTYEELAQVIAAALGRRPLRLAIPLQLLAALAPFTHLAGRLTGRPVLLNDQRLIDMRQCYWLCSSGKARRELGFAPHYDLEKLVCETAHWYQEQGWLS